MLFEDCKVGQKVSLRYTDGDEGTITAIGENSVLVKLEGKDIEYCSYASLFDPIEEFTKKPTKYEINIKLEEMDGTVKIDLSLTRNGAKVDQLPEEISEAVHAITDLL